MNKKKLSFVIAIILLIFAGACGPSPEQIATMTAAAWTPTPLPTPTATPLPYDLTVKVTDAEGNPIMGANVLFPSVGGGRPFTTNEEGQVSWTDLSTSTGSITATMQGYFPSEQPLTLERGPNEVVFALKRDPFGLLSSAACTENESLLYVEDFQRGSTDQWGSIESQMDGWSVGEHPEEPGNYVAINNSPDHIGANLDGGWQFQETVWRVRYFVIGRRGISFNWLQNWGIEFDGQAADDMRYQIIVGASSNEVHRLILPSSNRTVDRGYAVKTPGWHLIEISLFQDSLQIWIDGVLNMDHIDSNPLPAGTIGIELFPPQDPDTLVYFDDIRVCGLNVPFTSTYSSTP